MWNRKFGRNADHRKAMLRNLATSVILYGKVETTEAKAGNKKNIFNHPFFNKHYPAKGVN